MLLTFLHIHRNPRLERLPSRTSTRRPAPASKPGRHVVSNQRGFPGPRSRSYVGGGRASLVCGGTDSLSLKCSRCNCSRRGSIPAMVSRVCCLEESQIRRGTAISLYTRRLPFPARVFRHGGWDVDARHLQGGKITTSLRVSVHVAGTCCYAPGTCWATVHLNLRRLFHRTSTATHTRVPTENPS